MDLYEYQARELLEEQGIPTPKAIFAQNSHEVAEAADQIGYPNVIKAQVKIGHRGQAGGVKLAQNRDEAILASEVHSADDHPRAQGQRRAGGRGEEHPSRVLRVHLRGPAPLVISTCSPLRMAVLRLRKSPRSIRNP